MDRETESLLCKLYLLCPEWWRCAQVKMVINQVCANLTKELDGPAAEAQTSSCNLKVIAQTNPSTVRLPPFPTVSCKITPTGIQSLACSGTKSQTSYQSLG